jgi:hypothetical protein
LHNAARSDKLSLAGCSSLQQEGPERSPQGERSGPFSVQRAAASKPRAEALLAVAESGLRLIMATGSSQRTAPMEGMIASVADQIRRSRAKSVTITL